MKKERRMKMIPEKLKNKLVIIQKKVYENQGISLN